MNFIPDKVHPHINMFSSFMVFGVFAQMYSTWSQLTVTDSWFNPSPETNRFNYRAPSIAFVRAIYSALIVERATIDYNDDFQLTTLLHRVNTNYDFQLTTLLHRVNTNPVINLLLSKSPPKSESTWPKILLLALSTSPNIIPWSAVPLRYLTSHLTASQCSLPGSPKTC